MSSQIILFEETPLGERDYAQAPSSDEEGDEEFLGICGVLRIAALKAAGALDQQDAPGAHALRRTCEPTPYGMCACWRSRGARRGVPITLEDP